MDQRVGNTDEVILNKPLGGKHGPTVTKCKCVTEVSLDKTQPLLQEVPHVHLRRQATVARSASPPTSSRVFSATGRHRPGGPKRCPGPHLPGASSVRGDEEEPQVKSPM